MTRRVRIGAIAVAIAVTLVLSGCQNLPKRTAGGRCKLVGEHAQDGTWILKCGSNKRWSRLMTIDAANQAIGNWLRSQVPAAPPTTTTPPQPAITSFSALVDPTRVVDATGGIRPGRYSATVGLGSVCVVEVTVDGDRRLRGGDGGPLYVDLPHGATVRASGPCTWSLGEPGFQCMPANGDGMYRVGMEIQPGSYTAPGSTECYWETATDATASLDAVTDIYLGAGPQLMVVESTDRFVVSDDCGAWTPLESTPARYLQIGSTPANTVWKGHRAFYRDGEFNLSSTSPTAVAAGTAQYAVDVMPTTSAPFTVGVYSISAVSDATHMGVWPVGPGGNCGSGGVTGTAEVLSVTLAGDNTPTAMEVVAVGRCNGQPFLVGLKF